MPGYWVAAAHPFEDALESRATSDALGMPALAAQITEA
jgi:hypothetical protein